MAHHVDAHVTTAADNLRDALTSAERLLVNPTAQTVEHLLILLDKIDEMFDQLSATSGDLRAEEGRWEGIISRISRKPGPIASAAASSGGLSALRAKHNPAESFWWHVDTEVSRRRNALLKRMTVTIGSVIGVIAFLLWAVQTFFPPSPEAILMLDTNSAMEPFILEQDWAGARQIVEGSIEKLPSEPELWLWDAVFSEQLGEDERAQDSLARARDLLPDNPIGFWVSLANQRIQVGDLDGAEDAALAAIDIDPDEAQGYFVLASVAEFRGENSTAIDLFDQTFKLAEAENPQLAVIARVRMGTLMQQIGPIPNAAPDADPTAAP